MENKTKKTNTLLIVISSVIGFLLIASLVAYLIISKKNKDDSSDKTEETKTDEITEETKTETVKTLPSETIKKLQERINELLPSGAEKLVVDGIMGVKTKEAFDLVKKNIASQKVNKDGGPDISESVFKNFDSSNIKR